MAFFKLNISKINDNVERYVTYSDRIKEQSELVYNSLINADAYWSDLNTSYFISRVKQDGYKLTDYFDYLKSLYMEPMYFSDAIKSVCSKYGYKSVKNIKFDDTRLSMCIGYINQAIELININLSRLKSVKQSVQYSSLSSVNKKITDLNNLLKKLENLKEELAGFCGAINNCINNARVRKSKLEQKSLGISLVKYGWQTTSKSVETINDNSIINTASANNARMNLNHSKDSIIVGGVQAAVTKIDTSPKRDNKFNNNFVNYYTNKQAEIDSRYTNDNINSQYTRYTIPDNVNNHIENHGYNERISTPNEYVAHYNNDGTFDSKVSQYADLRQNNVTNVYHNMINVNEKHDIPSIEPVNIYSDYKKTNINDGKIANVSTEKIDLNVNNIPFRSNNENIGK